MLVAARNVADDYSVSAVPLTLFALSVLNRDNAWDACVKQLAADLSGSHDHYQLLGSAKTHRYLQRVIHSNESAVGKYFCQGVYTELLQYLFGSVGPFSQQYMLHYTACAPTYLASCAQQVAFGDVYLRFVSIIQNNCQPQYLDVSELCYCSKLMPEGVADHGPIYFQWELTVQKYNSFSGFLVFLNGIAEVQLSYSCTRVLAVSIFKGWSSLHILRVSHPLPKTWFQYYSVVRESQYGCENFQWTIA
jgi:hypothetical protein